MQTGKTSAGQMALGGVLSALIVALLYFAGISEVASLSVLAAAGLILCLCVLECGIRYAAVSYAVTAILSLVLCADKITAFFYITFFGIYSILKAVFEMKIHQRVAEWLLKFGCFNLSLLAMLVISKLLVADLGILTKLPWFAWAGGWILLNGVFLLYDIAITRVITFYAFRLRRRLFRK